MRNGRRETNRRAGFTSMELVVALIVAMILATVGAAGYYVYQREAPVAYAAKRLSYAAATARSYAIVNNAPYALQIQAQYNGNMVQNYWIDELDDTASQVVSRMVTNQQPMGQKVYLVGAAYGGVESSYTDSLTVKFFPDGSSDDVNLTLRQGDAGSQLFYGVRIYGPTGMSRVMSNVDAPSQTLALTSGTQAAAFAAPAAAAKTMLGRRASSR